MFSIALGIFSLLRHSSVNVLTICTIDSIAKCGKKVRRNVDLRLRIRTMLHNHMRLSPDKSSAVSFWTWRIRHIGRAGFRTSKVRLAASLYFPRTIEWIYSLSKFDYLRVYVVFVVTDDSEGFSNFSSKPWLMMTDSVSFKMIVVSHKTRAQYNENRVNDQNTESFITSDRETEDPNRPWARMFPAVFISLVLPLDLLSLLFRWWFSHRERKKNGSSNLCLQLKVSNHVVNRYRANHILENFPFLF